MLHDSTAAKRRHRKARYGKCWMTRELNTESRKGRHSAPKGRKKLTSSERNLQGEKDMAETQTQQTSLAATSTQSTPKKVSGLTIRRFFTKAGVSPYDEVEWEKRLAQITDSKGGIIFEQKNVEVPADWSMTATNIVASKYLHGLNGTDERESGVRALITRVAESIRDWGIAAGYFATPEDAATFYAELAHLLLNQKVAFNSPVWFNVGCDRLEPNSDAHNCHWTATTA